MSLVSTFVRMANDKWYKNPTISDLTNNWFLCFDDDDPPELVIYQPQQLSKEKRMERIFEIVDGAKIKARIQVKTVTLSNRLFPPNWSGPFKPSVSVFLEITHPIDLTNLQIKHEGEFDDVPDSHAGCVIYPFDDEWLKKKAQQEDGSVLSVGGLVNQLKD